MKRLNFCHRTLILTSFAVATGVLLLVLIYHQTNNITITSKTLVEQDVAALAIISQIQTAITEHQYLVSNYQTDIYLHQLPAIQTQINDSITQLINKLPAADEQQQLTELLQQSNHVSALLAQTLNTAISGKKHINSLLDDITSHFNRINQLIFALQIGLQQNLEKKSTQIYTTAQTAIHLAILSVLYVIIITLIIGYYSNQWRRYLSFPERNPNPVLSLKENGVLAYCNPGAVSVTKNLRLNSTRELLPAKLAEKLAIARSAGQTGTYWEYKINQRIFSCNIRHQHDLHCFHVYLADITHLKQIEQKLHYLAYHDSLTKLPNRHSFENILKDTLTSKKTGAVLLLRLDRFRFIVEALGHLSGDQVLAIVANRLSTLTKHDNLVCHIHRFEGNIFAILLPNITQPDELTTFTQQIADVMIKPIVIAERKLYLSLSIGISVFPDDGNDAITLLRHADKALQQVKRAGGNSIRRYLPEMDDSSLERLELLHELRDAEKRGELELYYQPQFDIAGKNLVGVEALIRWNHPKRGLISPALFIPLAEETDMIVSIGEWVLMTACKQNKAWQDAGLKPIVVAVNISPRQFHNPDLLATIRHSLIVSGLEPCWLQLELTEGTAMHDAKTTSTTLRELKSLGVKLSIDDFGTGYSSLAYLKRFPIDKLKIDQSFVRNMTQENSDAAIIRTIITLGHSLDLKLIAEGVENHDQLAMLKKLGCEEAQGYLFSKPLPHSKLAVLLEGRQKLSM